MWHLKMAAIFRGRYHSLFLFEFRFCSSRSCSKRTPSWLFPPRGIKTNVSTPPLSVSLKKNILSYFGLHVQVFMQVRINWCSNEMHLNTFLWGACSRDSIYISHNTKKLLVYGENCMLNSNVHAFCSITFLVLLLLLLGSPTKITSGLKGGGRLLLQMMMIYIYTLCFLCTCTNTIWYLK